MNSPTPRPKIGFVSLGCPKALVDSEVILTQLKSEGYDTTSAYGDADAVVVNTCGFLDSAREESLDAIGEALKENGKVIVTGCLGAEADIIRARFPNVAAITGAHAFDDVARAVHAVAPPPPADPFADLVPPQGVKLTPKHYAYLKISEGCDHSCSFCIIPQLRGGLVSRPLDQILDEAEKLKAAGVKELLVVAQDTSAYGLDLKYPTVEWNGRTYRSDLEGLCQALGELGVWVRLHYVYPYPHVDKIIPLMAEGKILPYLDIPFQHASPKILKAMRRPANEDRVLERIAKWREICPDLTLRSTFVVGFPGETEDDFEHLLSWVEAAKLSRVGVFAYENVAGAPARALDGHVAEDVKQDRRERLMALTQKLSRERLRAKIGKTYEILIDQVRPDGVTVGRTPGDAPEVDGLVYVRGLKVAPGDLARVRIVRTEAYDLWGEPLERLRAAPLRPGHRRLIGRH